MNNEKFELTDSQKRELKRLTQAVNRRLKEFTTNGFSRSVQFESEGEYRNHINLLFEVYREIEGLQGYVKLLNSLYGKSGALSEEENQND